MPRNKNKPAEIERAQRVSDEENGWGQIKKDPKGVAEWPKQPTQKRPDRTTYASVGEQLGSDSRSQARSLANKHANEIDSSGQLVGANQSFYQTSIPSQEYHKLDDRAVSQARAAGKTHYADEGAQQYTTADGVHTSYGIAPAEKRDILRPNAGPIEQTQVAPGQAIVGQPPTVVQALTTPTAQPTQSQSLPKNFWKDTAAKAQQSGSDTLLQDSVKKGRKRSA